MSKSVTLLLVLAFLVASCLSVTEPVFSSADSAGDLWESKAPMHEARIHVGVAVVNGKIYAIGGRNSSYWLVGTNEMYDPGSDIWTTLKPMPIARERFGIAAYQNKIYVFGGTTGTVPTIGGNALGVDVVTGVNEVYDTATDTWETKAPMPTARGGLQANVVDGKIYLIGGFIMGGVSNVTEVYDPASDSWSTMAPMPNFQEEFASAVVDSKIFIISDKVQIFTPKNNQWTSATSLPAPVYQSAAGATTGNMAPKRIYVVGGGSKLTQIYNPYEGSWTTGAPMPIYRKGVAVAVLNDKLYAIGGETTDDPGALNILATNEQYTPMGYGTKETEPFPTSLIVAALGASAAVGAVVLVYFKKIGVKRKNTQPSSNQSSPTVRKDN
jgi:N-acetylneuraminic acid mutarotase